jgi:GTP diphosphokinase / guanosine-3',5'-bis(diphosphate) 3'-diphosphatase
MNNLRLSEPKSNITDVYVAFDMLSQHASEYLDEPSIEKLKQAFLFAHTEHGNQIRKSGEPYIIHPLSVCDILCEYKMDETSLLAAILHDVVEDTHVSVDQVNKLFGVHVGQIVDGLTKLSKVEFRSNQEKMAENFRKMVVAMSKDIRVIIVKLADRLHNMRTLKALPPEKKQRIAEETLEIYAPLAGRLGIYRIKAELEDLCLKEIKPEVYFNLVTRVSQKKVEREKLIDLAQKSLSEKLSEMKVHAEVEGRAKHFYSIYKKMTDKKMEFEDIYDLFALRILVSNVGECYEALGVVHSAYKPVPGRFKDYIAIPKANRYQSLHTTVVAARGELLEIQIRTFQMHGVAETGVASHWAYKESKEDGSKRKKQSDDPIHPADLEKFNWLKQIVKHQTELQDPSEFMEAVRVDLFDEEVFVFSPKGDVFELSKGSSCLDFAFAVHSDLGIRTAGSKINGRMVPLRTKLHSGDVVEIISANNVRATKDWLAFVNTNKARSKIRAILRTSERDEARRSGQDSLESAFEKLGTTFEKIARLGGFQEINKYFSVGSLDDAILQVGFGKLDAGQVAQKLAQVYQPQLESSLPSALIKSENEKIFETFNAQNSSSKKRNSSSDDSVIVQGLDGILVRMAKCCEPLPGQPIVGYVSRGRGVTIHSLNCQWAISNDPARRVSCTWSQNAKHSHFVRLRILAHDRPGMLANVTKLISGSGLNIVGAEVQTTPDKRGIITVRVEVATLQELKDIYQKLEAQDGVIHVERLPGA